MGIAFIILLAISLAMDCFTVSLTSGMVQPTVSWYKKILMALSFGVFQAGMPLIGWAIGENFAQQIKPIDHWLAFAVLLFIGLKMIVEGVKPASECQERKTDCYAFRSIVLLSVATSIDALATGLIFVGSKDIWWAIFIIGLASFVLSIIGTCVGMYFKKKFTFKVELLGGVILIAIGTKILIEHLFF